MTGPADLGELMRTRRAVRRFDDRPVPDDLVGEILEAARWAPSPANLQPARFIWVRDAAVKRESRDFRQFAPALARQAARLSSSSQPNH